MNQLDLLIENYFTESFEASDLFRLVEELMNNKDAVLREQAETIGSDINEIWFAYLAAGSDWNNLGDGNDAQETLNERIAAVQSATNSPQEAQEYINIQKGRAQASLEETIKWASENGWKGAITKAYWTAREGTLEDAVNELNSGQRIIVKQGGSGGNPTDVALRFDNGTILGVSLKSTKGAGKITFKNGGFGSTISRLEALGAVTNYDAGIKVFDKDNWNDVKKAAQTYAAQDLPMALNELKRQPRSIRKQYAQALQYFGIPEENRKEFLIKKYRNKDRAEKKAKELEEWGRYLEALIPSEILGDKTFAEYAKMRYEEYKDVGNIMLGKARDIILDSLNQLTNVQRRDFLLQEYINASAQTPYWIKVTGMGSDPYSAKVSDVNQNPLYKALQTGTITFEPVAGGTIGVKADGEKIMTIRAKWESAPLTTSIKTDAKDW